MPLRRLSLSFAHAFAALFLLSPFTAHAQTAAGGAKPTGTISGKITVNEKGVPDILVAAQFADRPGQQPAARAKSDASGRYRLSGLPAGQYQITAIAPGLAAAPQIGFSSSFYGSGKGVVLASGEEADEVDIKLVQGSVITGRVTDADGQPVVEERINLQMVDQAGNPNNQATFGMWNYQMNLTDDRGIYRLYGLAAGRYRVSVGSIEGGFGMSGKRTYYTATFYGNTSDAARATIVELQEGSEATNIDIRVGRATSTFVVSGRVVDAENGQPIPGIRLMYGPSRPNQPFYGGFVGTPTNTRGEFRFENIEPGRYGVTVSGSLDASAHYSDPLLFEIADADVTNLELKAIRGLTLSGVVLFEGGRANELLQQLGTLRVGVSVTSAANRQVQTSSSSSIAPDGSFQISGVRPGKARLYISTMLSALRGITILHADRGGVDVTQNLEVHTGESITDLRIVATLGAGTIRGTVRFVGEPPPNLRLIVSTRRDGTTPGGAGPVDARGHFFISSLTSGMYEVTLVITPPPQMSGRPIKPQAQTVNVTEGGETLVDFIVDLTPKEGGP
jgi:protocatechuate 3,4-dioxygenase beta subunit